MQAIINDLLTLSRVSTRNTPFSRVDAKLSLDKALANLRLVIGETGATIICDSLPALKADGSQLTQLFQNLIGNAIKFRGDNPPRVEIGAEQQNGDWVFHVRDSGIGIPADRVEAIFEKFTQVDGSTTRKYGGTGLGLAISLQLVELMGGNLSVTSEVGRGSTFYFVIPLEEAPVEIVPLKEQREAGREMAGCGGRILLVEDNAVNQRLASILITRQGYEVEVASDGAEALEHLRHQTFALVLMDVQMPNMDGMEATRRIRAIEADPALRKDYVGLRALQQPLAIVGLTAHARKEDETACYQAGMNGFLTKPIVKAKLAVILSEMMPS